MAHVEVEATVECSAEVLWKEIGSFRSVGNWHPMLTTVDTDGDAPGARRVAHGGDGSRQVEQLDEIDPAHHRYRYAMVETPMPVSHYHAELQVDSAGDLTSVVRWRADFEVVDGGDEEAAVAMVSAFLQTGVDELARRHRSPAPQAAATRRSSADSDAAATSRG